MKGLRHISFKFRFTVFGLAFALILSCNEQTIHSGNLMLTRNPESLPIDFLPELLYQDAKPTLVGVLDTGGFWSPAQYAVLLQTNTDSEIIVNHYLELLRKERWQILQSRHFADEKKTVIVAENFIQQIVTIIINDGPNASIKLYLKKNSDD